MITEQPVLGILQLSHIPPRCDQSFLASRLFQTTKFKPYTTGTPLLARLYHALSPVRFQPTLPYFIKTSFLEVPSALLECKLSCQILLVHQACIFSSSCLPGRLHPQLIQIMILSVLPRLHPTPQESGVGLPKSPTQISLELSRASLLPMLMLGHLRLALV